MMFSYDKLFYFRYSCTTDPHIYDQLPLVIPILILGRTMICINIHWISAPLRNKFIQVIVEMRKRCINENLFRLLYQTIKYNPQLSFAKVAIRKYYISNCTNIKEVPSDQIPMVTNLVASLYRARFLQKNAAMTQHILQRKRVNPSVAPRFPNYPNYPQPNNIQR